MISALPLRLSSINIFYTIVSIGKQIRVICWGKLGLLMKSKLDLKLHSMSAKKLFIVEVCKFTSIRINFFPIPLDFSPLPFLWY